MEDFIRKFWASFKNIRVSSQSASTKFPELNEGKSAKGHAPANGFILRENTARFYGKYNAVWVWSNG